MFVVPSEGASAGPAPPAPLVAPAAREAPAEAPVDRPTTAAAPADAEAWGPVSHEERPEPVSEEELAALRRRFERPEAREEPARSDADALAQALLDELERGEGEALARACAEGRVFADFGPRILAAWDEFRRRGGDQADVQVFRAALRSRWGVDLDPPA
jgi:hypothetical protein